MSRTAAILSAALGIVLVRPPLEALTPPAPPRQQARPADFVKREGTRFMLEGRPYRVAGTHVPYLGWGTKGEVDRALDDASAMHFNVVRFFITGIVGSWHGGKAVPTVWGWPNAPDSANMKMNDTYTVFWDDRAGGIGFNDGEDGFGKIDYAIQQAGKRGLRLDIAFLDFWQYAGGSQQMRAWYGSVGDIGTTGVPAPQGGDSRERYSFFFRDPRTKKDYKALVRHILERRNALTGVLYKDDPTIFAWDLMNEPAMETVALAQEWKREMAAFVKSIDKHHLLCSGSEGFYDGTGGNNPADELSIPDLDFGTWHTYPAYHKIEPKAVLDLIRRHAADARLAGKPVILQEFGYGDQNADQVAVYRSWLEAIRNEPDCAGWLHWRLSGRMETGDWPKDNGEHFDARNDGGPLARLLASEALRERKGR